WYSLIGNFLSLGRDWRFPLTASHGQTSGSPPAKPGDYLIYLPAKLKGRRHEPALLPWIVREIAHWRGESEAALAKSTSATARRFFRLPAA
ncbi:MAG: hypothetical protein AB7E20_16950, partial [Halomonas sp.]